MAAPKKPKPMAQPTEEAESATLEQALAEEGEGRTPESINQRPKTADSPSKANRATKIMEEMWDNLQTGKVRRKDVIERFIDEAELTKAGASTYYGNIKKKLSRRT